MSDSVAPPILPPADSRARVALLFDLAGVGLACLVPALLTGALAVSAIVQGAYVEIITPGPLEIPGQLGRLLGGDPAAHSQQHPGPSQHLIRPGS